MKLSTSRFWPFLSFSFPSSSSTYTFFIMIFLFLFLFIFNIPSIPFSVFWSSSLSFAPWLFYFFFCCFTYFQHHLFPSLSVVTTVVILIFLLVRFSVTVNHSCQKPFQYYYQHCKAGFLVYSLCQSIHSCSLCHSIHSYSKVVEHSRVTRKYSKLRFSSSWCSCTLKSHSLTDLKSSFSTWEMFMKIPKK